MQKKTSQKSILQRVLQQKSSSRLSKNISNKGLIAQKSNIKVDIDVHDLINIDLKDVDRGPEQKSFEKVNTGVSDSAK